MAKAKIFSLRTQSHPLWLSIFGVLFVITGVYFVVNGRYRSIPSVLLGLGLSFSHMGFEIDFDKKMWREYLSFAFFKFGFWKTISHFEFVLVRKIVGKKEKRTVYKVILKDRQSHRSIELASSKSKNEAIELGKYIAENLQYEIVIDVDTGY